MSETSLTGYRCKCGKFIRFARYVYAHWETELKHTCDCGVVAYLQRGIAMASGGEILTESHDGA